MASCSSLFPQCMISQRLIQPQRPRAVPATLMVTAAWSSSMNQLRRTRPGAAAAPNHAGVREQAAVHPKLLRPPPLAGVWRENQGCSDWEGLVDPLDPLLRQEIIRYGELVMACYKAFDLDPSSKCYLNCKYGKSSLLREAGMADSGYEITKYIYATPEISNVPLQIGTCSSRWIGYIAVSSDDEVPRLGRRDILVAFRGTVTREEWIANMMSSLVPARIDPHDPRPEVKVEYGFLSLYTTDDSTCRFSNGSCREQLLSEVTRLINKHMDEEEEELSITLAGHSMGSSLCLLLGYDLAELGLNRPERLRRAIPITLFSFGGPRVGNLSFKERCEELGVKVLRVANVNDPVTKVPGVFLNESFKMISGLQSCYAHVGVEVPLDFFEMSNPAWAHDLEGYLGFLKCPKMMMEMKKNEAHDDDHPLQRARNLFNQWSFDAMWTWGNLLLPINWQCFFFFMNDSI